jgi:peptide/nickel transport system substrate-binding protein
MNLFTERRTRGRATRTLTAAVTVMALLAACSSGSTSQGSGSNATGTITIGTEFPPGTLDPTTGTQGSDLGYLNLVFDALVQENPQTGAIEPMLATSWKYLDSGKLELALSLRQGVKFQDGTPFNAQAVVTYTKAFLKAGDIANLLQYVTSVTSAGDDEVVYHLSRQNALLLGGLTGRAGMIPSPAAVQKEGSNFAAHPVGTGPYSFVSETQGASYDFTSFPDYWNNAAVKRVKNVDYKIFQSDTALADAIRTGDVDVAFDLASQDVSTLKEESNLTVSVGPGTQFSLAYFNSAKKPLNSPDIRLAINLALNRSAIAEAVTDGLGQATTEPMPPGTIGYVKSLDPVWTYDPAKAKQLVAQAGYPNGVNLSCYEYPGLGFETASPIIISELQDVGINLTVTPGTPAQVGTYFTDAASPQCFLADYGGGTAPGNYELLWSQSYYNAGKTNYGIDQYFDQFYSTYSSAGVTQIATNILKSQQADPGYAPIYTAPLVNVYRKNIGGWIASNLGIDNWRGLYYTS